MQLLHKLWANLTHIDSETVDIMEDIQSVVSILLNQTLQSDLDKAVAIWQDIQANHSTTNLLLDQLMAERDWIVHLQSTSAILSASLSTSMAEIGGITLSLQNLDQMISMASQRTSVLNKAASNLNSNVTTSDMMLALASTNISAVGERLEWVLDNIFLLQELLQGVEDLELNGDEGFTSSLQDEINQLFMDIQLLHVQINGSLHKTQEAIVHANAIINQSEYICKSVLSFMHSMHICKATLTYAAT